MLWVRPMQHLWKEESALNRAARSVTVASRPLGVLRTSQIVSRTFFSNSIFDFWGRKNIFGKKCRSEKNDRSKKYFFTKIPRSHIDGPPNFGKFIVILKHPANGKFNGRKCFLLFAFEDRRNVRDHTRDTLVTTLSVRYPIFCHPPL